MNTSVADENVDDLKTYLYNVTANDVIASTVKEIGKQFRQVNQFCNLIIGRSKKNYNLIIARSTNSISKLS